MILDAHTHLWIRQNGTHNGAPVFALENGKSSFAGEVRQMMPPYMLDGSNTVQMLISNMDYACVNGAVITQEVMDGNQNSYLLKAKSEFPERIKICSLYEEGKEYTLEGFDGIKLCACKLSEQDLTKHYKVFEDADRLGKFISIDLADGDIQTDSLNDLIHQFPNLKIAIGHFGMVTTDGWTKQIELARNKNVFIESGGITWLFNYEFYPYPSAIKAIFEASQICGFDKLMWGSDYPRTMVEITYKMSYDFILKSNEFDDEDKAKFLGKNAQRFYGFNDFDEITPIKNML